LHEPEDVLDDISATRVEGENAQVIQCWNKIPHEGHQEEWYLKDIFLDESESVSDVIIPGDGVK